MFARTKLEGKQTILRTETVLSNGCVRLINYLLLRITSFPFGSIPADISPSRLAPLPPTRLAHGSISIQFRRRQFVLYSLVLGSFSASVSNVPHSAHTSVGRAAFVDWSRERLKWIPHHLYVSSPSQILRVSPFHPI